MDPTNTLVICIEYAIGVAGFGGLIASVRGRPEDWTPLDRYRLANLLMFSFSGALLGFFSLYMLHLVDAMHAHQITSVVVLILLVFQYIFTQKLTGTLSEQDTALIYNSRALVLFSVTFALLAGGLQIAGIAAFLPGYGFTIIFTGILYFLTFATFQFLRTLFTVHSKEDT